MSKEIYYMELIKKKRSDCTFTVSDLGRWIEKEEGITFAAARNKASRIIKRLPCEPISRFVYKLTYIPNNGRMVSAKEEDSNAVIEVIGYLNVTLGTRFKPTLSAAKFINARLKEGFTVEDLKDVVKIKKKEWEGTEFANYLRPETLFGSKFQSYLNQGTAVSSNIDKLASYDFSKYKKEIE